MTDNHRNAQQQADGHVHSGRWSAKKPLLLATGVVVAYFGAEVAGAVISGSLALLADAAHTLSDTAALGLALGAAWLAGRPGTVKRTFGYKRAEVLAALVNGAALAVVACFVFIEASRRIASPPEVEGAIVSLVAAGGILANTAAGLVLLRGARSNLNVRAALFHVAGDAIGSVGVVIAGLLIVFFGWYLADPIAGMFIGVLLLIGALRIVRDAVHVLLEGTPGHIDIPGLLQDMKGLPGVVAVHDLHTWTITSGYDAMSAHVTMPDSLTRTQEANLLATLRQLAADRHGIAHVTLQLERGEPDCEEEAHMPEEGADGERRVESANGRESQ
ncbi:MAG: cation diffusion facilitator family transporter [Dehalococcoidia bacterium]